VQIDRLTASSSELGEYLRKHDYRFSHEAYREECDAFIRATEMLAGAKPGAALLSQTPPQPSMPSPQVPEDADGSDVRALVNRLNQLHEGWKVQCELIALGQEAVVPLVRLLLSPPSIFPQLRRWAAEALGIIGGDQALEGLCKVLSYHDVIAADPVVRLAEETVRNCAAEQLERLGDPRAIAPLLLALRRQPLAAAAQALASLAVDAAIPVIIQHLEDDFVRDRMASALLAFGPKIADPLIATLHRRRASEDVETPGSIGRRAAAASLLGELGDAGAVGALRPLLKECALEVRVEAAVALIQLAEGTVVAAAVSDFIGCLAAEHPRVRARAEEGLRHAGLSAVLQMIQTLVETVMIEKDGVRTAKNCPTDSRPVSIWEAPT
jgi:HEAT repeat protein